MTRKLVGHVATRVIDRAQIGGCGSADGDLAHQVYDNCQSTRRSGTSPSRTMLLEQGADLRRDVFLVSIDTPFRVTGDGCQTSGHRLRAAIVCIRHSVVPAGCAIRWLCGRVGGRIALPSGRAGKPEGAASDRGVDFLGIFLSYPPIPPARKRAGLRKSRQSVFVGATVSVPLSNENEDCRWWPSWRSAFPGSLPATSCLLSAVFTEGGTSAPG